MDWPWGMPETAAALIGVAAIPMAGGSVLAARRGRRLRGQIVAEALAAMAELAESGPVALDDDLVRVVRGLAGQHRLAMRVEGEIRPYAGTGRPVGHLIGAALDELRRVARRRGGPEPAAARRPATGPVPLPADAAELAGICDRVIAAAEARIRQAGLLLTMAAPGGVTVPADGGNGGPGTSRERIAAALRAGDVLRRRAAEEAGKGRLIAALETVAAIEVPVPRDGVPGEATRRELARHTARLREIAVTHEAELLGWLTDARARYAPHEGGTA
ncbi:hypothetical protein [Actinoplanes sp. NPDC051851]|uniref:hypothetical protein n=1 Tax=Actinoplanes sp. NPDC051851 TaxID=3154753 RepID=UPI00341AA490